MRGVFIELTIDDWREVYRRVLDEVVRKTIVDAVASGCLVQWFPEDVAKQILQAINYGFED